MSTISRPQNPEENPRVKSVFDDIRATRGSDFINNLTHRLSANNVRISLTATKYTKVKIIKYKFCN